jgi:hypothetical protein
MGFSKEKIKEGMLSNPASIFTLFDFFFSFLITFYLVLLPHPDGGGGDQ